jgi:riboflavin synthase
MFTGIIEDLGVIKKIEKNIKSMSMVIESHMLEDVKLGDSIATNGLCLTVTHLEQQAFHVDIMVESVDKSNLGYLKVGDQVHLEKAMRMGDRFGGHMVSGHIDGVGKLTKIYQEENAYWVDIEIPSHLRKYAVLKGSIAIDGISLTIARKTNDGISVSIIPHTATHTTLLNKNIGDYVNLEMDMMIKYVETLMTLKEDSEKDNT